MVARALTPDRALTRAVARRGLQERTANGNWMTAPTTHVRMAGPARERGVIVNVTEQTAKCGGHDGASERNNITAVWVRNGDRGEAVGVLNKFHLIMTYG